jgi:hypothetical protein
MMRAKTMKKEKALKKLRKLVRDAKGDNLERAEASFGRMSDKELDQPFGQSGQTCREVFERYKEERRDWKAVRDLVRGL